MNILISNDDGWNAPGIRILKEVASEFGRCTIVAPATEQSGVSHQITLGRPLELVKRCEDLWSLDGTPADCIRIALTQLESSFDVVLSGVNNGANLGSDVYVSGTFAAAREAALFGLPSMAISQHRLRFAEEFDWSHSKRTCGNALKHCLDAGLQKREVININLPDVSDSNIPPELQLVDPCPLDPAPRLAVYDSQSASSDCGIFKSAGKYNDRSRTPGCDVEACFAKRISVTRLRF